MFKRVLEVRTWRFCGCELVSLVDLMNLEFACLLRESTSPFIDEGDGLTSEREGIRLLLSLVSHTGGYWMMVGAHNTVWMSDARGRLRHLVWVWQMSVPAYTVGAQRHVRSFTMFTWYGKFRHPQHYRCPEAYRGSLIVWELMAPTIL